ncbi:MAG: secondary thiamine-phosphate synthase enzyme YjbQ [Actinobacteria bacterium]|nr:secondary thiamine-phosphate synthase enzyme YjbQ [Actinomycetota bacterium]
MTRPETLHVEARERLACVDLTAAARDFVSRADIVDGALMVFCAHTTCSILINEWEAGALEDIGAKIQELFPPEAYYAHDDQSRRNENIVPNERRNGHSHVAQMVMGQASQLVPISDGELLLGRWQRIFLFELDEPKKRTILFHAFGHSSAQSLVTNNQNASPAYLP